MSRFNQIQDVPGVYLLRDLDERALYVGQSMTLRKRLKRHFIRQDSNATADGLLDIYDVLDVIVWYVPNEFALFPEEDDSVKERMQPLDILEFAAFKCFPPRWNRAKPVPWSGPIPSLTLENADVMVRILDSPEEVALRRQPLERIEARLLHLVRAVRKAKISGASRHIREALGLHSQELKILFDDLLQKPRTPQMTFDRSLDPDETCR